MAEGKWTGVSTPAMLERLVVYQDRLLAASDGLPKLAAIKSTRNCMRILRGRLPEYIMWPKAISDLNRLWDRHWELYTREHACAHGYTSSDDSEEWDGIAYPSIPPSLSGASEEDGSEKSENIQWTWATDSESESLAGDPPKLVLP